MNFSESINILFLFYVKHTSLKVLSVFRLISKNYFRKMQTELKMDQMLSGSTEQDSRYD